MLIERRGLSERRACQITGQHRSTQRHQSPRGADRDDALRERLRKLSAEHPRWGYRLAWGAVRDEGWAVNRKKIQRLWREEGLRVPQRKRKRLRLGDSTVPAERLRAERPNHVWAMDFQFDTTSDAGIGLIQDVLTAKWRSAGATPGTIRAKWNEYVPASLLPRLYGFELMMAPYAIAHLKIGLKLHETGYDFSSDTRVNVVLTNSLETGPSDLAQLELLVPALADEARVASRAKGTKFTVVLGNPPYKNNSELTLAQAAHRFPRLLSTSRVAAQAQARNIRDDYAWFYAAADAYLDDRNGIICLVTSDSYSRIGSYRYFREQLLTHYRVVGLLRIGSSVFREVSPRISFAVLELLRRESPLTDAANCVIPVIDIRGLIEGVRSSDLATAADPRLRLLSGVADGSAQMPAPVMHEPSGARRWSFLPLEADLVESVLADSLPVFKRGCDRIFIKKWPGIITAFDDLLKAQDREVLTERMESFFDACYAPRAQCSRALDEWARSHDIGNKWLLRLKHVAGEIVRNKVTYAASNVKKSVSGSMPNELRWVPPPAYRHYIYYEPKIKIPRNVNPGKFEGWGSMEQWRDEEAHRVTPKLIFTTSTNPRSGYKAFVVDDEWFVKLHGGTSQQYHFTGLQVGAHSATIESEPNNLADGGMRMFEELSSYGLATDSLLHFVAAVYNSALAERFLQEQSGEDLQIRMPSSASEDLCRELVRQARLMRDLHQLLYDGASEGAEELRECASGLANIEGRTVVSVTGAAADATRGELLGRIGTEQEVLDQLVEAFYGLE